jgi:Fe-S-cluster containining protein
MTPNPDAPRSADDPLGFIPRPTPQLRTAVERQRGALPPSDFADFLSNVRSAFNKYTAKLLEFEPGIHRGVALHRMMDNEMKAAAHVVVTCCKGCSGCCHYEVEVTNDEAVILSIIVQEGLVIDNARLAIQAARERKSPAWRRFQDPGNLCVFLGDDGACRIYEHRPAICRKHLVTTPAVACTTDGMAVAPVEVLLAEILLSAATSIEGTSCGALPKMLLESLGNV